MTEDRATATPDRIFIRDLVVRCIIGVEEPERQEKQDVVVQIELQTDLREAGRTDDLADSIDYSTLKKQVLQAAEDSQYRLIEALAQRIAEECLSYERVECVRVIVEKPGALRAARTVGVEIVRRRPTGK
jgi:dihydroneopterin aldolase/D-erythro-7,8-dihydroneopterin triphosphate epimerase